MNERVLNGGVIGACRNKKVEEVRVKEGNVKEGGGMVAVMYYCIFYR